MTVSLLFFQIVHGFTQFHMHTHPDRDSHVTINWDNIISSRKGEFTKCTGPPHCNPHWLKYDCDSVMHYASDQMSRNRKATISKKKSQH